MTDTDPLKALLKIRDFAQLRSIFHIDDFLQKCVTYLELEYNQKINGVPYYPAVPLIEYIMEEKIGLSRVLSIVKPLIQDMIAFTSELNNEIHMPRFVVAKLLHKLPCRLGDLIRMMDEHIVIAGYENTLQYAHLIFANCIERSRRLENLVPLEHEDLVYVNMREKFLCSFESPDSIFISYKSKQQNFCNSIKGEQCACKTNAPKCISFLKHNCICQRIRSNQEEVFQSNLIPSFHHAANGALVLSQ